MLRVAEPAMLDFMGEDVFKRRDKFRVKFPRNGNLRAINPDGSVIACVIDFEDAGNGQGLVRQQHPSPPPACNSPPCPAISAIRS